jgi:hypothetical protein
MNAGVAQKKGVRATNVVALREDAGHESRDRPEVSALRERVEHLSLQHRLVQDRVGIDKRRFTGHCNGL